MNEATITINGRQLTVGQSMTVRVAVNSFMFQLQDKHFREGLGDIAVAYELRLGELIQMIEETKG